MKKNVAANPENIRFFGARVELATPTSEADLLKKRGFVRLIGITPRLCLLFEVKGKSVDKSDENVKILRTWISIRMLTMDNLQRYETIGKRRGDNAVRPLLIYGPVGPYI